MAALSLFALDVSAQRDTEQSSFPTEEIVIEESKDRKSATPKKGDILLRASLRPSSIGRGINGTSLMSALRFGGEVIVSDNIMGIGSLGIGLTGTYFQHRGYASDSITGTLHSSNYNFFTISPRAVLHLDTGVKNLDFYTGLELHISGSKSLFPTSRSDEYLMDYRIRSFLGANYYLSKRIALFGEIGTGGLRTGFNFKF